MESEIKTFTYDNGEIQRVQAVAFSKDEALGFFKPVPGEKDFAKICALYRDYVIPKWPWVFGRLLHFTLPEGIKIPAGVLKVYEAATRKYGFAADDIGKVTIAFREGLFIKRDGRVFERKRVRAKGQVLAFFEHLKEKGCAHTCCGRNPVQKILPVGHGFGLLSESEKDAKFRSNATFFIMDVFDVTSAYDVIGTPFGLTVENGTVLTPPLYQREAFVVREGKPASVEQLSLKDLTVRVGGKEYRHGQNGTKIFERHNRDKSPLCPANSAFLDLAVVGRRVLAVKKGGLMTIPSAGFVLRIKTEQAGKTEKSAIKRFLGEEVTYLGLEDVKFAVSAGNSILINGKKTLHFISKFYNIRHFWTVKYPPSLYPLDFEKARAPRMAIGARKDGTIVILWVEGRGKFTYEPGVDSCGASLLEMTDIAEKMGLYNAVNLDGGGSSQILLNGEKKLKISDRNKADNSEAERAIPLGIKIN